MKRRCHSYDPLGLLIAVEAESRMRAARWIQFLGQNVV